MFVRYSTMIHHTIAFEIGTLNIVILEISESLLKNYSDVIICPLGRSNVISSMVRTTHEFEDVKPKPRVEDTKERVV